METIKRTAKFYARFNEGLLLFPDDALAAISYAEHSKDAISRDERDRAHTIINLNPHWEWLLLRLSIAAVQEDPQVP